MATSDDQDNPDQFRSPDEVFALLNNIGEQMTFITNGAIKDVDEGNIQIQTERLTGLANRFSELVGLLPMWFPKGGPTVDQE